MSLGRAAPAVNARSAVDRMWSRRTVAGAEDRHTQRRHRIVCTLHAGGSGADTRTCAPGVEQAMKMWEGKKKFGRKAPGKFLQLPPPTIPVCPPLIGGTCLF